MKPKKTKKKMISIAQRKVQTVTTWFKAAKNRTQNAIQDMRSLRELDKFAGEIGSNLRTVMDTGEMLGHLSNVKLNAGKAIDSNKPLPLINQALLDLKKARRLAKTLI